jgi:hypothetical protein
MSELQELAYVLEHDHNRCRYIERGEGYDVVAFSFDGVMEVRRTHKNKILDLPDPTFFYQYHEKCKYISTLDSLYALEGCPIFSQKMIDVLLSVHDFKYRKYPIAILEERDDIDPYEDVDKFREMSVRDDLFIFQVLEALDIFDWERSDYRQGELDKELGTPSHVRKFVLKTPETGFPPLFHLLYPQSNIQSVSLFISREARAALKNAGITGTSFASLLRPRGNSEIDVPLE